MSRLPDLTSFQHRFDEIGAAMAEPAFFLGLLVLAKLSGSLQLTGMLDDSLASHWLGAGAPLA